MLHRVSHSGVLGEVFIEIMDIVVKIGATLLSTLSKVTNYSRVDLDFLQTVAIVCQLFIPTSMCCAYELSFISIRG